MLLAGFQKAQVGIGVRVVRLQLQECAPRRLGLSILAGLLQCERCLPLTFRGGCRLTNAIRGRERKHRHHQYLNYRDLNHGDRSWRGFPRRDRIHAHLHLAFSLAANAACKFRAQARTKRLGATENFCRAQVQKHFS